MWVRDSGRAWLGSSSALFGVSLSHSLSCDWRQLGLAGLDGPGRRGDSGFLPMVTLALVNHVTHLLGLPHSVVVPGRQTYYTAEAGAADPFQARPRAGMGSLLPCSIGQSKSLLRVTRLVCVRGTVITSPTMSQGPELRCRM